MIKIPKNRYEAERMSRKLAIESNSENKFICFDCDHWDPRLDKCPIKGFTYKDILKNGTNRIVCGSFKKL